MAKDPNTVDPNDVPDFQISPEEQARIKDSVKEDNEKEYFKELEEKHHKNLKALLADENIIEAFPTEQKLVVEKLDEYWKEAQERFIQVKKIRNIVDNVQADPFSKWFFVNVEKYKEAERLKWLYQQIKRLERLKVIYEKKRIEALLKFVKFDTKEERKQYNIDRMFQKEGLLIDILMYDGRKLKGHGNRYMTTCPFHEEKTASFAAYADNWYHCFGCQEHGNFFDYLMKTRNVDFKQALVEANGFL